MLETFDNFSKYKSRLDFVFSYWIFLWYLLFILGFKVWNPKLALIIGIIANSIKLIWMMWNSTIFYLLLFIVINVFIKVIPLLTLWNCPINFVKDSCHLLILFIIYLIWLVLNGLTLYNYKEIFKMVPLTNLIDEKISDNIKKNYIFNHKLFS